MTAEIGSQLAADLKRACDDLETARGELLQTMSRLSDSDLARAPRGQWSVQKVLEHVLQAERLYVAGLAHLQGNEQPSQANDLPHDLNGFVDALAATRAAALSLLEEASESTFYEIRSLGHEEYSPLSLLENVAMHDREHAAQIEQIIAES